MKQNGMTFEPRHVQSEHLGRDMVKKSTKIFNPREVFTNKKEKAEKKGQGRGGSMKKRRAERRRGKKANNLQKKEKLKRKKYGEFQFPHAHTAVIT